MSCRRLHYPWLVLLAFRLWAASQPRLTAVPEGPIHVEGNRLIDSRGHAFLIRGTQLEEFRGEPEGPFGPHSATVFSTIRQRWNMNAVRLPLNLADYESDPKYLPAVAEVVHRANELELLVILSAHGPGTSPPADGTVRFWRACAGFFRDYPQVIFELDSPDLIEAVRAGGAKQPVLVSGWSGSLLDDGNTIYSLSPRYRATRTVGDRDRQFELLAERVPVLVSGLDPELDRNSAECASLPSDPSEAEALVEANLDYFDDRGISWVASEFRPGKLIGEYRRQVATSLENGWTCGRPESAPFGIGEVLQFHLWGGELRGLFAVNGAGSFRLPRDGIAIVYGGIFAVEDSRSARNPPPKQLGGVSVRITDRTGVARAAGLRYVSAGWGQANFVVPPDCAPGPARVTVERRDGTSASASAIIVDVAPGLWTATGDGRGPVIGFVTRAVPAPIYRCDSGNCATVPIRLWAAGVTIVRLLGTGFRHAAGLSDIQVKIGGIRVPVMAYGPTGDAGADQLTVRMPASLRGMGETDLVCLVHERLSNVVRINIGPGERRR